MNKRIIDHPILGKLENRTPIAFTFDGKAYEGFEGETIASALLANGIRTLRVHEESGTPRGIYCNIGHCYECRLTVDHIPGIRACLTEITTGMNVESGSIQPAPLKQVTPTDVIPRTYADFVKKENRNKEVNPHV